MGRELGTGETWRGRRASAGTVRYVLNLVFWLVLAGIVFAGFHSLLAEAARLLLAPGTGGSVAMDVAVLAGSIVLGAVMLVLMVCVFGKRG